MKRNGSFSSFKMKTLVGEKSEEAVEHLENLLTTSLEPPDNFKENERHSKCCSPLHFASPVFPVLTIQSWKTHALLI